MYMIAHVVMGQQSRLDLFYNVPARRRFLKSTRTEFSYLDEVIKKIALANFNVSFTVTNNGKRVRDFLAVEKEMSKKE